MPLWIDGQPAAVKQPLRATGEMSFSLDVTEQAKDGENVLRWKPNFPNKPDITSEQNGAVPELNLVWKN